MRLQCARSIHHGSRPQWTAYLLLLVLAAAAPRMFAQASAHTALDQYTNAVARAQPADRIRDLEQFAWSAHGQLRVYALDFVIWEYLRAGNRPHAATWANELHSADPDNALALALICDDARNSTRGKSQGEELLRNARRGLHNLPQLRHPLGMKEPDFARLKQQSLAMLKGAEGYAELQQNNYFAARSDLRDAVALDGSDAGNLYWLALADLEGKDANTKDGYWSLARAVELCRGTPQGKQMAQYARRRYVDAGGTNAGWDQFLYAASAANRDLVPRTSVTATSASSASSTIRSQRATASQQPASSSRAKKTTTVAKVSKPPLTATSPNPDSSSAAWADNTTYTHPPIHPRVSSGPISLGILIETSLTRKGSRDSVVGGLTDMLRHMSDQDEAFILTYDNHLVFEQDLTTDPKQLEEAMQNIRPQRGADLDEAVAFAAGHLARIAKYPNRVLLVISDGRNVEGHASPLQTSAQINAAGVRIFCIGMDVSQLDGRYRLEALSSGTGGRSEFISGTGQFRQATKQIAQNIGIDFRF